MDGLKQTIQNDTKEALKGNERERLSVLRLLSSAIQSKEKEKRYKISKEQAGAKEEELQQKSQLTEVEIVETIVYEIKKRKDSIVEFQKGNRPDLVKKEKYEIEVLQKYLPKQLTEEEVKNLVKEAVVKTGAKEIKDMGKVMAELILKVKGKADGALVSKMVKELLVG